MRPFLFLLFMVIIVVSLMMVNGCDEKAYEARLKAQGNALPDTITFVYSWRMSTYGISSVEGEAYRRYPDRRIVSVRFLGVAHDPDCFYEVKMVRRE